MSYSILNILSQWGELPFVRIFQFIFSLSVYYLIFRVIYFGYKNFLRRRVDMKSRYGKATWALVTGATDGIGKAFCEELALEGFNIILVSRNPEKLKLTSSQLLKLNKEIQTVEIQFDFNSQNSIKEYTDTFEGLMNNYDISVIVNNVGMDIQNRFEKFTIEETHSLVNVNVLPQAMINKIFFSKLQSRDKRSAIIDVSSFASDLPIPSKALYSATKAFNNYLTIALLEENSNSNIDFLSLKPFGVSSSLTKKKADGFMFISARQCAASALNDLVHEKSTYGYWIHKVQAYIVNLLPRSIAYFMFNNLTYVILTKENIKKK